MNGNNPYGAMGGNGFGHGDDRGFGWREPGWREDQRRAGNWPDRAGWEDRRGPGMRARDSYGAPDRSIRGEDYNPGYADQDYGMGRHPDYDEARRGAGAYAPHNDEAQHSERGAWGRADRGDDYYGDNSNGRQYGQAAGREQWGRQGYGQQYSHRNDGTPQYGESYDGGSGNQGQQRHAQGYGDRSWQASGHQRQDSGPSYDESRSSDGNRRYPGLAGSYTGETAHQRGETQDREWGAFGGAGWGMTGGSGAGGWQGASVRHHRGRGPKGYERSDERIKEDICERLTDDPYIDASEITIDCRDGVVTLEGHIERRSLKHRVEDMADAVSGVKDIQNRLSVTAAYSRSGSDSWQSAHKAPAGGYGGTPASTGTPEGTRENQEGDNATRQ